MLRSMAVADSLEHSSLQYQYYERSFFVTDAMKIYGANPSGASYGNSGFESQEVVAENKWYRRVFVSSLFLKLSLKEDEFQLNWRRRKIGFSIRTFGN